MQQKRLYDGAPVGQLEELYEAATASVPLFTNLLNEATAGVATVVSVAPLKAEARVVEKARDDYLDRVPGMGWLPIPPATPKRPGGDVLRNVKTNGRSHSACLALGPAFSYVYDIVRGSVLCPDEDTLIHVVSHLLSSPKAKVLRLKNRFQNPTPG